MQLSVVDSPPMPSRHRWRQSPTQPPKKYLQIEKKLKKILSVENMYKLNWATGSTHGGAVQPIPWNCGRVTKPQAKWNHTYVKSEAARSTLRKNKNLNISYIIVTDIKVWARAGMSEGVTPWTSMRPDVAVVQGPAQNTLKWGKNEK